ncbi:MAG: hypothetical protein AAF959_27210 [Cyanobacteria bacterium P01_D01_bin.56]
MVHITVGATPSRKLDFTKELQLVKAAMLYADHVTLCSLGSSTMFSLSKLGDLTDDQTLDLLVQASKRNEEESKQIEELARAYKVIKSKKKGKRSRQELILERQVKSLLKKHSLDDIAQKIINDAGAQGIFTAIDSGLVELKYLDISSKSATTDYFELITEILVEGGSYPLLDSLTSQLVKAAVDEGKILPLGSSLTKAKQSGLSSELFSRLPSFDSASMDEIIDIRKELETPLIRFRKAIINFSHDIEHMPWQDEFQHMVDQVYLEHVEPAILEIEEAYKSNKPLLDFVSKATNKPYLPTTSFIGFLISQANHLPHLMAQAMSLAAGSAIIGLELMNEWKIQKAKIQKHQLYFYHQLGKKLN